MCTPTPRKSARTSKGKSPGGSAPPETPPAATPQRKKPAKKTGGSKSSTGLPPLPPSSSARRPTSSTRKPTPTRKPRKGIGHEEGLQMQFDAVEKEYGRGKKPYSIRSMLLWDIKNIVATVQSSNGADFIFKASGDQFRLTDPDTKELVYRCNTNAPYGLETTAGDPVFRMADYRQGFDFLEDHFTDVDPELCPSLEQVVDALSNAADLGILHLDGEEFCHLHEDKVTRWIANFSHDRANKNIRERSKGGTPTSARKQDKLTHNQLQQLRAESGGNQEKLLSGQDRLEQGQGRLEQGQSILQQGQQDGQQKLQEGQQTLATMQLQQSQFLGVAFAGQQGHVAPTAPFAAAPSPGPPLAAAAPPNPGPVVAANSNGAVPAGAAAPLQGHAFAAAGALVQGPPAAALVQGPPAAALVQGPPAAAVVQGPPAAAVIQGPPAAAGNNVQCPYCQEGFATNLRASANLKQHQKSQKCMAKQATYFVNHPTITDHHQIHQRNILLQELNSGSRNATAIDNKNHEGVSQFLALFRDE